MTLGHFFGAVSSLVTPPRAAAADCRRWGNAAEMADCVLSGNGRRTVMGPFPVRRWRALSNDYQLSLLPRPGRLRRHFAPHAPVVDYSVVCLGIRCRRIDSLVGPGTRVRNPLGSRRNRRWAIRTESTSAVCVANAPIGIAVGTRTPTWTTGYSWQCYWMTDTRKARNTSVSCPKKCSGCVSHFRHSPGCFTASCLGPSVAHFAGSTAIRSRRQRAHCWGYSSGPCSWPSSPRSLSPATCIRSQDTRSACGWRAAACLPSRPC